MQRSSPTVRSTLLTFAAGSAAAIAVAVVGGYFALRSVAIDEAKRDTRTRVQESGHLVEASLPDGILAGEADAIAAVDELVLTRVLTGSIVRVKLWSADGRVLYSDEPAQIGDRYPLDDGQLRLLREGGAEVEVSDLAGPENDLERPEGELIEAYTSIRTPSGSPLLFEIYERFDSVTSSARRLLTALAPPILGALALILLVQVPLMWSLTRRLQTAFEEREGLLASAIGASGRERRRIASYLHDGPVQDIAGIAFALAPVAERVASHGAEEDAAEIRRSIGRLRHNIRDLRTLLVDLHPVNLTAVGLDAAVADLVSPLLDRGANVDVTLDAGSLDPDQEALVYRVVQEAVRNVIAHADARTVRIALAQANGRVRLVVSDDGRGFPPDARAQRAEKGHLGLSLLEGLVRQAGGRLEIRSAVGEGTSVELEVPGT